MIETIPAATHPELPPAEQAALGHVALMHVADVPHFYIKYPEYYPGVEAMANFQGSWTIAQAERMASPVFESQFEDFLNNGSASLRDGHPKFMDKPAAFKSYYANLISSFEETGDHVYEAVDYAPAAKSGNMRYEVGRGGIGQRPVVFSDAETMDGVPLTPRQKDIIGAHEAYHGMVTVPGPARDEVLKGFDNELYISEIVPDRGIKRVGYMQNPDELMARMAQLKNYFGMRSFDTFTKEHMDYARGHYVQDTGLDNSMSVMMQMVSTRTEPEFLRLMNTLPV